MRLLFSIAAILFGLLTLSGCQDTSIDDLSPKATRELPDKIVQKMKAKGIKRNCPVYFRLFKDEHVVEVWKQKDNGKFDMVQNYNICAWSGTLGAKYKQGDRGAGRILSDPPAPDEPGIQIFPGNQHRLSQCF